MWRSHSSTHFYSKRLLKSSFFFMTTLAVLHLVSELSYLLILSTLLQFFLSFHPHPACQLRHDWDCSLTEDRVPSLFKKKRACPPAAGFKNALKLVILHKALCWNVICGMSFVTHIAKYVQTKISRIAQCSAKSLWKLYFQNKSDHFRYFQRTGVKLIGSRLEFSCSAPNTSLLRQ